MFLLSQRRCRIVDASTHAIPAESLQPFGFLVSFAFSPACAGDVSFSRVEPESRNAWWVVIASWGMLMNLGQFLFKLRQLAFFVVKFSLYIVLVDLACTRTTFFRRLQAMLLHAAGNTYRVKAVLESRRKPDDRHLQVHFKDDDTHLSDLWCAFVRNCGSAESFTLDSPIIWSKGFYLSIGLIDCSVVKWATDTESNYWSVPETTLVNDWLTDWQLAYLMIDII